MEPGDGIDWKGGPGTFQHYVSRGTGATNASLHGCPELSLVLGRDGTSSGVAITMAVPSGGVYPHQRVLFDERWQDVLPGEEGVLEIAIQALQACLGRIRGLQG